nr:EAL domain-containing protein [Rhodothalassium salexigens]
MFQVLLHHDGAWLAVAAMVGFASVLMTLSVVQRAPSGLAKTPGPWWLTATGVAGGGGIWAAHAIALLAFEPLAGRHFDLPIALAAVLIGVASVVGAVMVMAGRRRSTAPFLAAVLLATGFALMHWINLAGLIDSQLLRPSPLLVIAALALMTAVVVAGMLTVWRAGGLHRLIAAASMVVTGGFVGYLLTMSQAGEAAVALSGGQAPPDMSRMAVSFTTMVMVMAVLGVGVAGVLIDRHLARAARVEARRVTDLANVALESIVLLRDDGIVEVNRSFCRLTGQNRDSLIGCRFSELFIDDHRLSVVQALEQPGGPAREFRLAAAGQAEGVPVELSVRETEAHENASRVGLLRDLRDQHEAEARIRYLAQHDALTRLPNRALFGDRLAHALQLAERYENPVALLLVDVDRLQEINKLRGQDIGDGVLRQTAKRIKNTVRGSDTVACLGGDTFAVIQEGMDQPHAADKLARRLLTRMGVPLIVNGNEIAATVSIGIAVAPTDALVGSALLAHAESALQRSKDGGRNRHTFYEARMEEERRARQVLGVDLRNALRAGDLHVHFQPVADVGTGSLLGFEALARWTHPERGVVPPGLFIPVAEESGAIVDLGEWVLETVCQEATRWPLACTVAVNISVMQFEKSDLVAQVDGVLERTGLDPARLELEITESVLIHDTDYAVEVLNRLKARGVRIVLDDFGTGYSSLSYLKRFPFDKIKIDRSFVSEIGDSQQSAAIVRGVIGLARGLGVPVVAEGVEQTAHVDMLREEGCDQMQGYLIGRPAPIEDYGDLVFDQPLAAQPE